MEFEAYAELSLGKQDELTKKIGSLAKTKPIHKPAAGTISIGATAPTLAIVECTTRPAIGRVWNVLSVSVFGADAHTPAPITSFIHDGTAAAPAANTNISGNTVPTPGSYLVSWNIGITGTPAAPADTNNFNLIYSPTIIGNGVNPAAVGQWSQTPVPLVVTPASFAGGTTLHINNIGAATAGTQYNAGYTAIPQFGPGQLPQVFADIYAGALSSDNPATQQVFTDVVASAALIPSVNYVPDKAIWLHGLETIYAVIYNPPANSQFVLTARVGEYPVEAVEALGIG